MLLPVVPTDVIKEITLKMFVKLTLLFCFVFFVYIYTLYWGLHTKLLN